MRFVPLVFIAQRVLCETSRMALNAVLSFTTEGYLRMSAFRTAWICVCLFTLESCSKPPVTTETPKESVAFAGHHFREVRTLGALPSSVRAILGVGKPGLDGIADAGGKYNITDVVDSRYPMRSFVVAGVDDGAALVALERGGIGWSVAATLYSNTARTPSVDKTWGLFESPHSLRALIEHLPSQWDAIGA